MNKQERKIFNDFNNAGWIAFYHPRKKTISINGGPAKTIKNQIQKMREALQVEKPRSAQQG